VSQEPSLLIELIRRHPVGPVLYLVGLVALGILWLNFEPGIPTSGLVKVIGLFGIAALAVGMPLAHKHAFKLQSERRARQSARASSPWDSPRDS
jgi:hypothetical protein